MRQRYTSVIFVGLLLFLVIYIGSAGAAGNFISRIITSFLGSSNDVAQNENGRSPQPPDTKLTVPDEANKVPTEKVTEQLNIPPFNLYTIQLAAFTNGENAQFAARELQSKGGAGYILNDEYFRLLATGFAAETDAQKVKQQLKDEGIESQIYTICSPGVNMEITASADKVSSIKSAFSLWLDKTKALEDVVKKLDTSAISVEDARKDIEGVIAGFNSTLDQLKTYSATQESNYILAGLLELYQKSIKSLESIFDGNVTDRVVISSKLKYTYIGTIYSYKQYMDRITKE
jgi:hypothetical protein